MEYISKHEATRLCAAFYANRKDQHEFDAGARYAAKQLLSSIKNSPAANVVEIVRCKDCEHRDINGFCEFWANEVKDDGFCSYGWQA